MAKFLIRSLRKSIWIGSVIERTVNQSLFFLNQRNTDDSPATSPDALKTTNGLGQMSPSAGGAVTAGGAGAGLLMMRASHNSGSDARSLSRSPMTSEQSLTEDQNTDDAENNDEQNEDRAEKERRVKEILMAAAKQKQLEEEAQRDVVESSQDDAKKPESEDGEEKAKNASEEKAEEDDDDVIVEEESSNAATAPAPRINEISAI